MKTRGWGPWREDFYSVCSAHLEEQDDCSRCQCGSWHNRWKSAFGRLVYMVWPGLWIWWANLPRNKKKYDELFEGEAMGDDPSVWPDLDKYEEALTKDPNHPNAPFLASQLLAYARYLQSWKDAHEENEGEECPMCVAENRIQDLEDFADMVVAAGCDDPAHESGTICVACAARGLMANRFMPKNKEDADG